MSAEERRSSLSSDSEEEFHTYRLRIHDASLDDAGEWQCSIRDKYGEVTTSCSLNILEELRRQNSLRSQKSVEEANQKAGVVQNGEVNGVVEGGESKKKLKYIKEYECLTNDLEPGFIQALNNTTVKEGSDFRLTCAVIGSPAPEVKWFKDNKEIFNDELHRIVIYRDGLTFIEVRRAKKRTHNTVYRCEARSILGMASCEAKVTVLDAENFEKWDQERLNLQFATSPVHPPNVYKKYYNKSRQTILLEDTTASDRMLMTLKDEGDDLHTMYNNERHAVFKLNIGWDISRRFYFAEHLKSKCVVEGELVKLSCFVSGIPPFVCAWYKDNMPLNRNVYERYFIRKNAGHMSLEIPVTTLEDTGEYVCEVRNEQGHISSTCNVQVEPYLEPDIDFCRPYFAKNVSHVHVQWGGTAVFTAIVKGNPRPNVKWFKDGMRIQQTNRTTMHQGEKGMIMLKIHEADHRDIGLYKCEAHSMAGRCQSSAKLLVFGEGKPRAQRASSEASRGGVMMINGESEANEGDSVFMAEDNKEVFVIPPKFIKRLPETTFVRENQMLFLEAKADGYPRPSAGEWFFNNEPVTGKAHIKAICVKGCFTLEIKNFNAERDSGYYTLKVTHPSGTILRAGSEVKAVVKKVETEEQEEKKEEVKKVEKYGLTEVTTKRETKTTRKKTTVEQLAEEVVKEAMTKAVAEAVAESVIDTVDAPVEKSTKKSVTDSAEQREEASKPEFVNELPKSLTVLDTDTYVRLQASFRGKPSPKATWKKNGNPVEADGRIVKEWDRKHGIAAIEFKSVSEADSGEYELTLTSSSGSVRSLANLVVKRPDLKPSFLEPAVGRVDLLTSDKNLKLECKLEGRPTPEIKWHKNGSPVAAGDKFQQEWNNESGVAALVVTNLTEEDSGVYECVISSPVGVAKTSSTVSITKPIKAPEVVEEFQPKYAFNLNDKDSRIVCKIDGNPAPTIQWTKNGEPLTGNGNISEAWDSKIGEASLRFAKLTLEDAGKYECIATSAEGSVKLSTQVEVQKTPTVEQPLKNEYSVQENEKDVKIQCKFDAFPAPKVTWYKDGSLLPSREALHMTYDADQGLAQLHFTTIRMADAGSYECVAENAAGETRSATKIGVRLPDKAPSVVQGLNSWYNFMSTATNVKLTFQIESGSPPPTISWLKDGEELALDNRITSNWDAESGHVTLTFCSIGEDDSGKYTCMVKNSSGTVQSLTTVKVKEPEREPSVKDPLLPEYAVTEGNELVIRCKVDGNPEPEIAWTKNGQPVDTAVCTPAYDSLTGEATLTFKQPSYKDSGSYECLAVSDVGKAATSTNLKIERKETEPKMAKALEEDVKLKEGADMCKLQCTVEGFPVPQIEWLKDGSKLVKSDKVVPSYDEESGVASLELSDITCEDAGRYDCVATSSKGTAKCGTDLRVEKKEVVPSIVEPLEKKYSIIENEGELNLCCKVNGYPTPEVKWELNGKTLQESENLKITYDNVAGEARLVLVAPKTDDSGTYECICTSKLGTSKTKTEVAIEKPEMCPSFERDLSPEKVLDEGNQNVSLTCTVVGNPLPDIVWKHNGKVVKTDDHIAISNDQTGGTTTLTFKEVVCEDDGEYVCEASSKMGTAKSSCAIKILRKETEPVIGVALPTELNCTEEDSNVCLRCQVGGYPVPEVTWLHNGEQFPKDDSASATFDEKSGEAVLKFNKISSKNAGVYECVCKSKLGTAKTATSLVVQKPETKPSFGKALKEEYVYKHNDTNVRLECTVEGNPCPDVSWLKDGSDFSTSNNVSMETNPETGEAALTFKQVVYSDAGLYECVASSKAGTTKSATNLVVTKPEVKPTIAKPLCEELVFEDGEENVTLTCNVEGNPAPTIVWSKNGTKLEEDDKISMSYDESSGAACLRFKRITTENTGTYQCAATSAFGNAQSTTNITVQKTKIPPQFKNVPQNQNVLVGGSAIFKCTATSAVDASLLWRKNGEEIAKSDKYQIQTIGLETCLTVTSVTQKDAGDYICVASNKFGDTESSGKLTVEVSETKSDAQSLQRTEEVLPVTSNQKEDIDHDVSSEKEQTKQGHVNDDITNSLAENIPKGTNDDDDTLKDDINTLIDQTPLQSSIANNLESCKDKDETLDHNESATSTETKLSENNELELNDTIQAEQLLIAESNTLENAHLQDLKKDLESKHSNLNQTEVMNFVENQTSENDEYQGVQDNAEIGNRNSSQSPNNSEISQNNISQDEGSSEKSRENLSGDNKEIRQDILHPNPGENAVKTRITEEDILCPINALQKDEKETKLVHNEHPVMSVEDTVLSRADSQNMSEFSGNTCALDAYPNEESALAVQRKKTTLDAAILAQNKSDLSHYPEGEANEAMLSCSEAVEVQAAKEGKATESKQENPVQVALKTEHTSEASSTAEANETKRELKTAKTVTFATDMEESKVMSTSTAEVLEELQTSVTKLKDVMKTSSQESKTVMAKSDSSSRIQIVDIIATPIDTMDAAEMVEHLHHHHSHHAPELIIPAKSQNRRLHSDIELVVKVKAAKKAKAEWLHDGQIVTQSGHYEMVEEEEEIDEK